MKASDRYILVLNGPNLNLTGRRRVEIYGSRSLEDIMSRVASTLPADTQLCHEQHNCEGAIIDSLHRAGFDKRCRGIVLNAGAYSHYSHAIADAIEAIDTDVVEVHLSNIYARDEEFRHTSVIAPVCKASVCGMGEYSYIAAANYLTANEVDHQ